MALYTRFAPLGTVASRPGVCGSAAHYCRAVAHMCLHRGLRDLKRLRDISGIDCAPPVPKLSGDHTRMVQTV